MKSADLRTTLGVPASDVLQRGEPWRFRGCLLAALVAISNGCATSSLDEQRGRDFGWARRSPKSPRRPSSTALGAARSKVPQARHETDLDAHPARILEHGNR
jgi:hypothetical protein